MFFEIISAISKDGGLADWQKTPMSHLFFVIHRVLKTVLLKESYGTSVSTFRDNWLCCTLPILGVTPTMGDKMS